MVDRLDQGAIPSNVCQLSYSALHKLVAKALFRAHVEGKLKVGAPIIDRGACTALLAGWLVLGGWAGGCVEHAAPCC